MGLRGLNLVSRLKGQGSAYNGKNVNILTRLLVNERVGGKIR